jgi:sugar phosphate isomerase/epimerase
MKLAFVTLGCPAWTVPQIVENARSMGFDGVDLRGVAGEHIGPDEAPESRARIRGLFAEAGVEPGCIMGYSAFTVDDEAKRRADAEGIVKLLGVARDIGCPMVRVFGGQLGGVDRATGLRRVVACLRQVAAHAGRLGVRLALETHDDWCTGRDAMSVVEGVGSPALGVCWDLGNGHLLEPMRATFDAVKGSVIAVHVKDLRPDGAGRMHSCLPGEGVIDLAGAVRLLRGIGYAGYLSFEWEKKWEPAIAEPEVAFPHYVRVMRGRLGNVER